MTSIVSAVSIIAAPAATRYKNTNWPVPVNAVIETAAASQTGTPRDAASIPNAIATEK